MCLLHFNKVPKVRFRRPGPSPLPGSKGETFCLRYLQRQLSLEAKEKPLAYVISNANWQTLPFRVLAPGRLLSPNPATPTLPRRFWRTQEPLKRVSNLTRRLRSGQLTSFDNIDSKLAYIFPHDTDHLAGTSASQRLSLLKAQLRQLYPDILPPIHSESALFSLSGQLLVRPVDRCHILYQYKPLSFHIFKFWRRI